MKFPKNMTESEVMQKIQHVVDRISPKYTFYSYDLDDIKQEAYIICIEALERYDEVRPLENFLAVNLSNRLKNLIRDNYFNSKDQEKKKVVRPQNISQDDNIIKDIDIDLIIDAKLIESKVENELPAHFRSDYLKFINGIYLSKKKKTDLINVLKNIVENKNEKG